MNQIFSTFRWDLSLIKRKDVGQCRIRASNDVEAIERWLDEYFDKPTTFRAYKKEAERFLVWCVTERNTSLSELKREDVLAYGEFLKNPMPKEKWCGPRRQKSPSGHWYPFSGSLSESAIRTSMASLNSLMRYLVDACYLEFNPFILVKSKNRFTAKVEEAILVQERILQDDEWHELLKTLEEEPEANDLEKFKKHRLRFLVSILFFLGLRIDELARAIWSDCRKIDGLWWFFVRGKGNRLGKIPINSQLLETIIFYRHVTGKTPVPAPEDTSPLIFGVNKDQALSVRQMSNLLKELSLKAAEKFPKNSSSFQRLMRFSPHWLRHLSASHQDRAGISFTHIKSNLRHQNEQTTRIYVHAHDTDRHMDMEKLKI
jgi:site-specific recombinase XerD